MASSPSLTPQQSTTPNNAEQSRSGSVSSINSAPSTGLGLPTALKPIGFHNEQNTCFFNSTFQALSATAPLISLLSSHSSFPLTPSPTALLPPPKINPDRIPSLNPECLEPPLYNLLPVTRAFENCLRKAWTLKDAGGGTTGPSETSSSRSMSLRSLLREIAKKYDQYDDYRQQDAHELLRHLLDSMEMEEKDVVKRLQPAPPVEKGTKAQGSGDSDVKGITPLPSAGPSSPVRQTFEIPSPAPSGAVTQPIVANDVSATPDVLGQLASKEIPENERMIPFVDVLFGGLLASVVVCEQCKSVSHTYEGFLDISLSLKGDGPKPRKRDRFKAMAQRLRPRGSSKPAQDAGSSPVLHPAGVVSDTDGSDAEPQERDRRRSLDQDDVSHDEGLRRNSSGKGFGLKPKSSSIFRRKGSRPNSQHGAAAEPTKPPPMPSSAETSPQVAPKTSGHHHHHHGPGPTAAQSAYIQRILSGPPGPPESSDPLAKLKAAQTAGEGGPVLTVAAGDSGLIDSLKAFTSVEVLEGENAFACKKCWKINSGKYVNHQETVKEEDEGVEDEAIVKSPSLTGLSVASSRQPAPSISVFSSSSDGLSEGPTAVDDKSSSIDRQSSIHSDRSVRSVKSSLVRAPSPLRTRLDNSDQTSLRSSLTELTSVTSNTRSDAETALVDGEEDSDGLSETDSSDDEKPAELPIGRPKMPARTKSKHFVMRRAFKRYLIAKAPEVLVFHFKRFKQTHKTSLTFSSFYNLKKMDDFISFPERIDLAPFLAPDRNDYKTFQTPTGPHARYMDWPSVEQGPPEPTPVMYNLYAVVVHLGTMLGGHYIAYCLVDPEKIFLDPQFTPADIAVQGATDRLAGLDVDDRGSPRDRRMWCYCSDTSIRLASLDEVLNARAYLCFYEKL